MHPSLVECYNVFEAQTA